jgi:hypothetical protein
MDTIAGVIEVMLAEESHEIVVRFSGSTADVHGKHKIVIMPRYARHLAQVLVEYAEIAEEAAKAEKPGQLRRKQSSC